MFRGVIFVIALSLLFIFSDAPARNTIHKFAVADFMVNPEYSGRLEGVSFYFGDQSHPDVVESFGEYRTNKKTNAFNKPDKAACEWVMLSAMLALHERAKSLGANAVINIKSNYKDNVESSATQFTCGAGAIMAGVALIGTFVTINEDQTSQSAPQELKVAPENK